ncbi:MAG: CoA transferase [Deltaproteobacteria bacterium]|nr:CoA transferase [Deltaproteobacteria bacterium]
MTDAGNGVDAARPLTGVQVLDFTVNLPGPYASFLLASLGAEVIKVEPPRGDPARHMEPMFTFLNRGKRSVVLDLREQTTRPALRALAGRADVLLEGFRPGVMGRLGCDWETARRWNPRLIYCSISAHGQEGPRVHQPGHDLNLQALAGVCHLERDAHGTPRGSLLPVADLSTSLVAVASVCAALAARGPEGEGRYLDVAMSDAVLSWAHIWGEGIDLGAQAREALGSGPAGKVVARTLLQQMDREKLYTMPHYGVYRTRDRRWLALGIVDEKHFWQGLCEATGLGRLAKLSLSARIAGNPFFRRLFAVILRRRNLEDWLTRFEEAGVPATPVLRPEETKQEAQFLARGMFDREGRVRAPLPDARHPQRPAPALGEHTEQVLAELDLSEVAS